MQFKDKIETYLLLCLERSILELRQQNWMSRDTSRRILKWIDRKADTAAREYLIEGAQATRKIQTAHAAGRQFGRERLPLIG